PREYFVEPLARRHDRAAFSCGAAALDAYLQRQAAQDLKRRVAAVFVLISDGETIAGFYTLSALGILLGELPAEVSRKLPKYPVVPATLMGRLAVSVDHRGQGLGEFLLMDALRRAWEHSHSVASFAVVVDGKDEAAVAFYHRYGFIQLPETPMRLFLPMATIEKLFRT
ncbi:MAG: GNAT family N-acetyltransferase, partial [Terriglobales bacterium]